jgi:hypothetical protein
VADLRDRGQIILIAAFALAVTFIALALVVNSAIFTENLASRGETTGSDDALTMRLMVERGVGEGLETANRNQTSDSHAAVADDVEASTENMSGQLEYQQAGSGALVDVSYQSKRDGKIIIHDDGSDFVDASAGTDYEVASDVSRVSVPGGNGTRAFRINATQIDASNNASAFEVKAGQALDENDESWRTRIWEDGGTVTVRTHVNRSGSTTVTKECSVDISKSYVQIDLTEGEIADEPCGALRQYADGSDYRFATGAGDTYNIYFRNADQVEGNFSATVHDDGLGLPNIDLLGSEQPYAIEALYDVTVTFTYDTPTLHYETEIRVAPGEPDA